MVRIGVSNLASEDLVAIVALDKVVRDPAQIVQHVVLVTRVYEALQSSADWGPLSPVIGEQHGTLRLQVRLAGQNSDPQVQWRVKDLLELNEAPC